MLTVACTLVAQGKPAGEGEVVAITGLTLGKYRVYPYSRSPVSRFPYRIEIDLADGQSWRALPRFQNQHTDFDEPFEKAPVDMTVEDGGQLLVFSPFTSLPGEVIDVTYMAPPAAPTTLYLLSSGASRGVLEKEIWYLLIGMAAADRQGTLHLKPGGQGNMGQVLNSSSVEIADLSAVFHGAVLIGTITQRAGENEPRGRFRWTFHDGGRQFDGDWWSGDERRFLAGERIPKP